jgi:hypothetical protein
MASEHNALRDYVHTIDAIYRAGHATEHSYRGALADLLHALVPAIIATNEPKRVACGAPDYVITRGTGPSQRTIGYAEAKDTNNQLAQIETTEQLTRYRAALENLLLTNYLELRWYIAGKPQAAARIAILQGGRIVADPAGLESAAQLLAAFLNRDPEPIRSPKDLAERMARLTHMIRDIVVAAFDAGSESKDLKGLHETFKKVLIPDLSVADFADMFAQTLAYGLFAARVRHTGPALFTRVHAAAEIPRTNPLLRRLFATITGPDLDAEPYAGFVDELAELLAHADMPAILADFGKRTRQQDPIVHFYETFLQAYDPRLRELRGVYYTPEPVVSYIVRSVDALLKRDFGCPDGLADASTIVHQRSGADGQPEAVRMPRVLLLDPACGTGTFLYAVVDAIRERFMQTGNAGMWSGYVREHLLPRLFGFELLMAPYAMAHLKLGMQLAAMDLPESQRASWAYDFAGGERLGVYLTNTLEEAAKRSDVMMAEYISDEANEAAGIKRDDPVMVVLGNPPYSGHSANKGKWISEQIEAYKEGFPELKKPAQAKWLSDDYVKFIRFAQWRIERTAHGIVALITNHSYLDNPTFRGMRRSLMRSFDEIYLLNIHGNSKKKERAPDGGKDENVFDIQQGVAIGIFVRRQREPGTARNAAVYYADLWGEREAKYAWLAEQDVRDTEWVRVEPHAPQYLFVPKDMAFEQEYEDGWPIPAIFSPNGDPAPGIVTTQDDFAISWSREEAFNKVERLLATSTEQEAREIFTLCSQDQWQYERAKRELASGKWRDNAVQVLYRPFDVRWTIFDSNVAVHRRERVMRQMLRGRNVGLSTTRSIEIGRGFEHVLCSRLPIQHHTVSIKEVNYLFPLYLYPDASKSGLWDAHEPLPDTPGHRRANLAPAFVSDFAARLGMAWVPDGKGDRVRTFGPEDVFSYMYAVFHAPTYRERYAEFLKIDFPRLPLTSDPDLFRALCALGDRLVGLHLMEQRADVPAPSFPVPGDNRVEQVRYTEGEAGLAATVHGGEGAPEGCVWINRTQYFAPVPPEVWEFHIGGYQVCDKWLKDRKGRVLTYDELNHYAATVAALAETRALMDAIDEAIEEHGGWPFASSGDATPAAIAALPLAPQGEGAGG